MRVGTERKLKTNEHWTTKKRKINGLIAPRQARLRNSNNFLAPLFSLFNQAPVLECLIFFPALEIKHNETSEKEIQTL